jgi:lysozyme
MNDAATTTFVWLSRWSSSLGAITDFTCNLGLSRLKASTLHRKLKAGDIVGARAELLKWTRGGDRVLPGLVIRRKAEAAML